jgi:murein DD-endopeptidase MepM/ murein hydrolase activator NlpD
VSDGMQVKPGTVLGYVGTTGNAAGTPPHLHYGVYETSGAINPYPILQRVPE